MNATTDQARTTSREEIAANVRAEMARRQVTQRQIADTIGKSQAAVSSRMTGESHFRIHELQQIAAFLEVPIGKLIEPSASA